MRIPLFPFGLVLFPGARLPIHFFEPRYRAMIEHCLRERQPFGIALIKEGRAEPVPGARPAVPFSIGALAKLERVEEMPEGRCPQRQPHEGNCYMVIVRGGERFRITALDRRAAEYLVAEVDLFPDEPAPLPALAMVSQRVVTMFDEYYRQIVQLMGGWQREAAPGDPVWIMDEMSLAERRDRLTSERQGEEGEGEAAPVVHAAALPEDPVQLSYAVANEMRVKPDVKQDLLEVPSALLRMQKEAEILTEETANLEEQVRIFMRRRLSGFGQAN
jgi:Lon protease-like protein